jgi:nicotinamidase-related amidase
MTDVVIVADMIKGFLEEGYPLYLGQKARGIIPNVRRMLEEEKQKGSHIIFLADNHEPDDRNWMTWRRR